MVLVMKLDVVMVKELKKSVYEFVSVNGISVDKVVKGVGGEVGEEV